MAKIQRNPFVDEGIMHATVNGHRLHLRLTDPTKDNFLWINGQPPVVLDQVAAEFVGYFIQGMWKFQQGEGDQSEDVIRFAVDSMYQRYGKLLALPQHVVTRSRIRADFQRIIGTIMGIAQGTCPLDAGLAMKEISPVDWAAPARMDLAVTYKCNLNCAKCYLRQGSDKMPELTTDQWKLILKNLWSIGVPQVVFTGGEPTLRHDLVELVAAAEQFVTGLVTNGTQLVKLAEPLHNASLDYAQVTIESSDPAVHNRMVGADSAWQATVDGIRKALGLNMQVVTNTTLTRENATGFIDLMRFMAGLGVRNIACNSLICSGRGIEERKRNGLPEAELKAILEQALGVANELGVNLQWYSPTCYHQLNPVELGLGAKGCSAASNNMTIQPDGTVLPCQSWPKPVGDILQDPWPQIWSHETCKKLRERGFAPEECSKCAEFSVCGGGCPLERSQEPIA